MKKQLLALVFAFLLPPLYATANILSREDGLILIGLTASSTGAVLILRGSEKNNAEGCKKVISGFTLGLMGAMIIVASYNIINTYDSRNGYGLDT